MLIPSLAENLLAKFTKKIARAAFLALARLESRFDAAFLVEDVPLSRELIAWELLKLVEPVEGRRLRVLEIGSREVTGPSQARRRFADAEYTGFDFYPGKNVDVVGDVHRLSSYFGEGEQFDMIYSIASFEHFAMPWQVSAEIAKLLRVGGIVFVATHFSYAAHERPWNFFQFSDMGLRVLFPDALGFACLEAGMSAPIVARFSALAAKPLRLQPIRGLYSGSEYVGRKLRDVPAFAWDDVSVDNVVHGTVYPAPKRVG